MNNLNNMNKLIHVASSLGLDHRMYVDEQGELSAKKQSITGLMQLVKQVREEVLSSERNDEDSRAIFRAAVTQIRTHLQAKKASLDYPIIRSLFQKSIKRLEENIDRLDAEVSVHVDQHGAWDMREAELEVVLEKEKKNLEAVYRIRFFGKFKTHFPTSFFGLFIPGRPKNVQVDTLIAEARLIECISKRIFSDTTENYQSYSEKMTHFVQGSHMIFEEEGEETLAKEIASIFSGQAKSHYKEKAESSHYKKDPRKLRDDHQRISGLALFPEVLICPEELSVDVSGNLIKGKPHDENFSERRRVTALQNENFSDGPTTAVILPPGKLRSESWRNYFTQTLPHYFKNTLRHRTVDFSVYVARKSFGSRTPNVSKHGFGVSDNDAIVISNRS